MGRQPWQVGVCPVCAAPCVPLVCVGLSAGDLLAVGCDASPGPAGVEFDAEAFGCAGGGGGDGDDVDGVAGLVGAADAGCVAVLEVVDLVDAPSDGSAEFV